MIKTLERFDINFLDASRLSTFGRCEARFLFKCLMGLKNTDQNNLNIDYGTVMHRVLPHMYQGLDEEANATFDALWTRYGYGEEDSKRNTAVSRRRISAFISNHSPSLCPYEILHYDFSSPTDLISPNEVPFLIDIGSIYPLCGRIDAVIKWKATGAKFAYDFKTSSEISPRYFDGFWFAPQPCSYTLALAQITGEKIEGLVIEAMRISEKNIEDQRGFVFVSETNLRQFIKETKMNAINIRQCNELGLWRQNNALCSSYSSFGFPCAPCEYRMICDTPNWEDAARFFKREKAFNPLDTKEIG